MPFWFMKTSLIGLPFVFGSSTAIVAGAVAGWHAVHRRATRVAMLLATLLGTSVVAATGVNAYFAYYPSVGALLGHRAMDQAPIRLLASAQPAPPSPLDHGVVVKTAIPGTMSAFHARAAQVYVPPAWFASPRPALPVVELLHGTPGTPDDWTRAGFVDVIADRWAAAHGGVAPLVVMPDPNGGFSRDTECVDGREGNAETYLTDDVHAWVVDHLGALPQRGAWAIVGSSEGGYCAAMLALRHPGRWTAFVDLSGLDRPTHPRGAAWLLGGPARVADYSLPTLVGRPVRRPMAAWFEVGAADGGVTTSVRRMAEAAQADGIDTRLVVLRDAHHTWRVWHRSLEDAFPWLMAHLVQGPPYKAGESIVSQPNCRSGRPSSLLGCKVAAPTTTLQAG